MTERVAASLFFAAWAACAVVACVAPHAPEVTRRDAASSATFSAVAAVPTLEAPKARVLVEEPPGPLTETHISVRVPRQGATPALVPRPAPKLTLKWSAKVGKTTFRTTMALHGGKIVIGTHGATLAGKNEKSDGVYVLDAATGKLVTQIAVPGKGDLDVGGVALSGDRAFFSSDAGLVAAARLDGTILWTRALSGKVRPAPALANLRDKTKVDVVIGDEAGTLSALNGDTGEPIWTVETGQGSNGARGFIAAAAIVDLDNDGIDDVIAGARDGMLTAYRGRDGAALWRVFDDSGMHASPSILDLDGDGRREVLVAWSYSTIAVLDARNGAQLWGQSVQLDGAGIEGLFATPVPLPDSDGGGVIVTPTSWWGKKEDGVVLVGPMQRNGKSIEGRTTSSSVVTDLDGDGTAEAILVSEAGKLISVTAAGTRAELASLPGGAEATPLLADLEGDGTFELLVSANDGLLRCYGTGSTAVPLVPRFRGSSPDNRGFLGSLRARGFGDRAKRGSK